MRYLVSVLVVIGATTAAHAQTNLSSGVSSRYDFCRAPNVIAALLGGLHKTPGMVDADLKEMTTIPADGFDVDNAGGPDHIAFVCHATITFPNGNVVPGRIAVDVVGNEFKKISWLSDEDHQRILAATKAQYDKNNLAQLKQQRQNQEVMTKCDPSTKSRYETELLALGRETAEYMSYSHANETAQQFSQYADHERLIARVQAEELQACAEHPIR